METTFPVNEKATESGLKKLLRVQFIRSVQDSQNQQLFEPTRDRMN